MIDPLTIFIILFFVFGMSIIFMTYYFERIEKRPEGTDKASEIVREREVIVKEIVMIPLPVLRRTNTTNIDILP